MQSHPRLTESIVPKHRSRALPALGKASRSYSSYSINDRATSIDCGSSVFTLYAEIYFALAVVVTIKAGAIPRYLS